MPGEGGSGEGVSVGVDSEGLGRGKGTVTGLFPRQKRVVATERQLETKGAENSEGLSPKPTSTRLLQGGLGASTSPPRSWTGSYTARAF